MRMRIAALVLTALSGAAAAQAQTGAQTAEGERSLTVMSFNIGWGVAVESAVILGEAAERADIVVVPWPSDHRAVAATLRY